jgi:glutathione synthase/RimK-type ligase-like ATP-grasp enzyme
MIILMVDSILNTHLRGARNLESFLDALRRQKIETRNISNLNEPQEELDEAEFVLHARRASKANPKMINSLKRVLHKAHWMRGNPNVENKKLTNDSIRDFQVATPCSCSLIEFLDPNYLQPKPKFPIMVKYVYGSLGKGIYKVHTMKQLNNLLNKLTRKKNLYQVQEFIQTDNNPNKSVSHRLFTFGGKIIGHSINSQTDSHVSNLHAGGDSDLQDLGSSKFTQLRDLTSRVANKFVAHGLLWGGQDWLIDHQTGQPYFLEVNSVPGFRSLGINTIEDGFKVLAKNLKAYQVSSDT